MSKTGNVKRCEIVSNLSNGDKTLFDMNNLKLVLSSKACIKDYCYIVHDKDVYTEADELKNPDHKEGRLKPAHIHLLLRFQDNQPQKLSNIAKWFKIPENFVQKIKSSWLNALSYQIHKNAPEKYQYDVSGVNCNFDYVSEIADLGKKKEPVINGIIERILSGEIREYNKTLEIDNMILVKYSKQINEAFKVRSEHLQATVKERHMECIYISGQQGCGKSTLAKKIADERGLDYYISSSSNDMLGDYKQEPVIILDDIRPENVEFSNLLKLLENWTVSSFKSRYRNKSVFAELIIITTVMNIDTFCENAISYSKEPIDQLKRRCGTYIRMDKENIYISVWDNKAMRYTNELVFKNNLLSEYVPDHTKTEEEVEEHINSLIPFLEPDTDIQQAFPFNLKPRNKRLC